MDMYKNITELKDTHKGQDIWIICAGGSMNYVNSDFFDNKITIGVNQVYRHFPCDYLVMKDLKEDSRFNKSINELKDTKMKLLFSEFHAGHYSSGRNNPEYSDNFYMFNHMDNGNNKKPDGSLDLDCIGTDVMACVRSSITSAMNIAAYMGASNIIISGADNGSVNGRKYYDGYMESHWVSSDNYGGITEWLGLIKDLNIEVRDRIKEVYGCNIYSLNPFWNFGLEGNNYEPFYD
tara:strand:+ start:503 stop:1207 length:705 start_codon:yes stop_codon:yes gene_type:complete